MQVSRINSVVPNKKNQNNKNNNILINKNKLNNQSQTNNNNISFKGGLGPIDSFCLFIANLIENGGLFVSFTLQDMLGTNLPRPFMGLKRNSKENNGQKNTKFALKELTREMITGPSMFIIPAICINAGKKIFGKATEVPAKFIKSFGDIHASNPLGKDGKAITKTEFYKNAFEQIIKNAKSETTASETTVKQATDFALRLSENITDKALKKDNINKLTQDFTNIVKNHAKDPAHTDFTKAIVSENAKASFKDTINFMTSYADDIVKKAQTQNPENIKTFINKLVTKKTIGRFSANILIYGMVLAFLQFIPKLYNKAEGKENAGLKGLKQEETYDNSNSTASSVSESKGQAEEKKDASKPSFGSSSAFVDKITGNGLMGRIASGMEFQGINLSFPLLLGVMGLGIVFPRIKNAKDKYDREEILRRDLITCAVMCFAEKELRKGFSKLNEVKSGMVLATKQKGIKDKSAIRQIWDYLRPIKGVQVLSTEQIISKYSGIDKYKDGIKGFCEFIEGQGGNLSKVFSVTDESKSIVDSLLKKEGKDILSSDNSIIKEVLSKAKDSDEVKKLVDLFKDRNNPWVKKARTINSRFTAFSVLVLVPVFLGFMLPWINEKTTKKRFNIDNQLNKALDVNDNNKSETKNNIFELPSVFSDMSKFQK